MSAHTTQIETQRLCIEELEAELRRIAKLVVDVMHERAHSGELLAAIEEYRDR